MKFGDKKLMLLPDGSFGRVDARIGTRVNLDQAAKMSVDNSDVVLDLGAHVGAYTLHALHNGAKQVVSVEPMLSNVAVLQENVEEYGDRVRIVNAAAVAADCSTDTVQFYPAVGRTGSYSGSLMRRLSNNWASAIEVPAARVDRLLEGITKVKVDVEGAEYELGIEKHLDNVEGIVIDFHRRRGMPWRDWITRICNDLAEQGFCADVYPTLVNQWSFTGVWYR
jgi:FkbM family methyltransferase